MKKHFIKYKNHLLSMGLIAIIVAFIATGLSFYQVAHAGQIYPNIYIGDLNVGNLTEQQAMDLLNEKSEALLAKGLLISIQDKQIDLSLREYATTDPDLSRDLIKYDIEKTIDKAFKIGRGKDPLINLADVLTVILHRKNLVADVNIDEKSLLSYIKLKITKYQAPKEDAKITFINNQVVITKDNPGFTIEPEKLLFNIREPLERLETPTPTATLIPDPPVLTRDELTTKIADINTVVNRAPFTLEYKDKKWTISKEDIKNSLMAAKTNNKIVVYLDKTKLTETLSKINESIDTQARDAKFRIEDGRVVEFQSSQVGEEVDELATLDMLHKTLMAGDTTVKVAIKTSFPKVNTADVNDLGIKDLLGVGTSDFKGSPKNRIHNITVGANKLNGLLIKPGEEFSLLDALGDINGENGFKQELVIKGNRTVPEYGGGLCQIGTTTFRTTLASGLPITERANHSYRVSYYEPAGTDATIYDPAPDYKFINDTPGYILIQTKVKEDNTLLFEFWGTNDGREASTTKPYIYNITKPEAPKYIVTTELPAGQKKRVESAHNGANASFVYTVKYNNPEKEDIDRTFYSYYKPWAELWMIGATSTESNLGI